MRKTTLIGTCLVGLGREPLQDDLKTARFESCPVKSIEACSLRLSRLVRFPGTPYLLSPPPVIQYSRSPVDYK